MKDLSKNILLIVVSILIIVGVVLGLSRLGQNKVYFRVVSCNDIMCVGDSASVNVAAYQIIKGEETIVDIPEDTVISFSSDNADVISVNEIGYITALSKGDTVIHVYIGDYSQDISIKAIIPAEYMEFASDEISVDISETVTLPELKVFPDGAELAGSVEYLSDNEKVATISENGLIITGEPGKANITAICDDMKAVCKINVTSKLTGIDISTYEVTLVGMDAEETILVDLIPYNTTDDVTVVFASDDESVATVDDDGRISVTGPGATVITVTAGDFTRQCAVSTSLPMTGIYFLQTSIVMAKGDTYTLSTGYKPSNTEDDRTTTYTSSDENVVTVDNAGKISAVSTGTATITATCNGFTASCTVTVNIPISSVTLDKSSATINKGEQLTLTVSVLPSDTTESKIVSWSSSNAAVATVSNGVVTAVGSGQAVITASCGGKSATCTVTVPQPVAATPSNVNTGSVVIVLDPGHDAVHGGANYYGRAEQDLTLKVAQYCKAYLESVYGATVYMTRNDGSSRAASRDECLIQRCNYAQSVGANIMVSLHFNASGGHNASGAMVIVSTHSNVSTASSSLGNSILTQLCGLGLRNNGLLRRTGTRINTDGTPQDYYSITRNCALLNIPAVIVEHCYMDYDVSYVSTEESLKQLGIADAIGIANYLGL